MSEVRDGFDEEENRRDYQADSVSNSSMTGRSTPPTQHQLALMIWIAVFPTLTVINLVFGDWLATLPPILRTFVVATAAVPIVVYGIMPRLHRVRARLLKHTR